MSAELRLQVTIQAPDGIPASVVSETLEAVNRALREEAASELYELRSQRLLTAEQCERAVAYLRASRPNALLVREARTGSIVLGAALAGLAYWVLDKTLGETLSGSWKQSSLHHNLTRWLSKKWGRDAQATASAVEREFTEGPAALAKRHACQVIVDQQGTVPSIQVVVIVRPDEDHPVPRGNVPAPSNDGPAADVENVLRTQRPVDPWPPAPFLPRRDPPPQRGLEG